MNRRRAAPLKDFAHNLQPQLQVDPRAHEDMVDAAGGAAAAAAGVVCKRGPHVVDAGTAEDLQAGVVDLRLGVVDHDALAAEEEDASSHDDRGKVDAVVAAVEADLVCFCRFVVAEFGQMGC